MERSVLADPHQLVLDDVGVDGLAVGGEAHELVLAGVDLEAREVGEGAVEQAQRVGEAVLEEELDAVALADADRGGGPLAHAVDGDDRRHLEGGGVEGAGRVRDVVLGELDGLGAVAEALERGLELVGHPGLVLEPHRHRLEEGREPGRRHLGVRGEESGELGDGLVVEHHQVEVVFTDLALGQTVRRRVGGDAGVVLLAGEALLLGGGHQIAVAHQAGAAVVVEGADTEDVQFLSTAGWVLSAGCLGAAGRAGGLGAPDIHPPKRRLSSRILPSMNSA